ncbi:amino acid permease [Aliikangiella marina]|uniref:Amino acid permease n=1 Tax=Aliikangiella marina TaxID=1712262 RepID=A0A545T4D4_9GAMM|nr:amino acid permease [Aliikangiella marina]TQV72086.1 amino acid permease [Aliikangiella marina]
MADKSLKRAISLPGLVFYGVGTMIGGGIYALLGKVTDIAGLLTPWAIIIAGVMALFSAFSFAELSARYPKSGGPAFYLQQAFSRPIGQIFGFLVIATGVVSAATLSVAVSGFLHDLANLPLWLGQLSIVILLAMIACWGIQQSVVTVAVITLVEVIGLILVIVVNSDSVINLQRPPSAFLPSLGPQIWLSIFTASFLAFYAFIGFEDMVTLAEEVKSVKKNLPYGIVISLLITLLLYVGVSFIAVISVDLGDFASSNTPMAELTRQSAWLSPQTLIIISLLAGINGALVQIIMAARVLFGMARNQQAPQVFKSINAKTQTPINASVIVTTTILLLALCVDLTTLAKLTSGIILIVFSGVNIALLKVKRQELPFDGFQVFIWVPICGFLMSAAIFIMGFMATLGMTH